MPEPQKPPLSNQEAFALADRIKQQYYKLNVQVEDIVKQLWADKDLLKQVGQEKLRRFVYSTLCMVHELEPKDKEVKGVKK